MTGPNSAEMDASLIHMTSTYQTSRGDFGVRCRCHWGAEGCASRVTARNAGDAHLREANATSITPPGELDFDVTEVEALRILKDLGACPSCGSCAGYAEGPPCLTCHYEPTCVIPPADPTPCEHGVFGSHWVGATSQTPAYMCPLPPVKGTS